MKYSKLFALAFLALITVAAACAGKKDSASQSASEEGAGAKSAAVVFFSATGVTKAQAERLGKKLDLPVYEIVPAAPYTEADLDWRDSLSRSSRESADESILPETTDSIPALDKYKTLFVGYPIWWDRYPNIVATFMQKHKKELDGKTIVPFATSGSSTIDNSVKTLGLRFPFVTVGNGLLMNDVSDAQIDEWAQPYL